MRALSLEELASRADVDAEYVRQLAELGAFELQATSEGYGPAGVRRVHFLRMWEAAGYKGVADLVRGEARGLVVRRLGDDKIRAP